MAPISHNFSTRLESGNHFLLTLSLLCTLGHEIYKGEKVRECLMDLQRGDLLFSHHILSTCSEGGVKLSIFADQNISERMIGKNFFPSKISYKFHEKGTVSNRDIKKKQMMPFSVNKSVECYQELYKLTQLNAAQSKFILKSSAANDSFVIK